MGKNFKKTILIVTEGMTLVAFNKLFSEYSESNHVISTNIFDQAVNWSNTGKKIDEVILHEDFIEKWKNLTKSDARIIKYKKSVEEKVSFL